MPLERSDAARDNFMRALEEVGTSVGWRIERIPQHERFQAMLVLHGEQQVRLWLLAYWIRTAGEAERRRRLHRLYDEATWQTRLPRSKEEWRALYAQHGLEMDGPAGTPALLNSDWLEGEMLRCLAAYCGSTSLK